MTPGEFIAKWRSAELRELREHAGAQTHFNDLCLMLGEKNPTEGDPADYTFEKGASIIGGSDGWADVWKRGCFAWEYKSPGSNLDQALLQLKRYSGTLDNPPLLIVCDMERFRIHANWTNTVQQTYEFTLEGLADAGVRQRLKWAFSETDVEQLKPGKTRQDATREVADEFVKLAQSLRDRRSQIAPSLSEQEFAEKVAQFVTRMVFCMFAEDVDLLPNKLFRRLLELSLNRPDSFVRNAEKLFGAMKGGGDLDFVSIEWFNGGIFDDATALPLTKDGLKVALSAARKNWSDIDPSIMGTLFERGLDPSKRSQLGAHYTDAAKIMLIVTPVIVEPLTREWEAVRSKIESEFSKAKAAKESRPLTQRQAARFYQGQRQREENARRAARKLFAEFTERLAAFRVLDPACGSGNFLYLALKSLKDLEHEANQEFEALSRSYDVPIGVFVPSVGPQCVQGIEINPFAAELARVSVWIGEIQWMREHGFPPSKEPILKPLETIKCRDALLKKDGSEAEWPPADVIIGNPPFLGGKKISGRVGMDYLAWLQRWDGGAQKGSADLAGRFILRAQRLLSMRGQLGYITTNTLVQGDTLEVGLAQAVSRGLHIRRGRSSHPWPSASANLEIVDVWASCAPLASEATRWLDGEDVPSIGPDLEPIGRVAGRPKPLTENEGLAYQGSIVLGLGFVLQPEEAERLLDEDPRNAEVLLPYMIGQDLNQRPNTSASRWVINFQEWSLDRAEAYPQLLAIVDQRVRPERQQKDGQRYPRMVHEWWKFWQYRVGLEEAIKRMHQVLALSLVSNVVMPVRVPAKQVFAHACGVFALEDFASMAVLSSSVHSSWVIRYTSTMRTDIRYALSDVFLTLPRPASTPDLEKLGERLDGERRELMLGRAWGLTTTYNHLHDPADRDAAVVALRDLHADIDHAVLDAYGWSDLDPEIGHHKTKIGTRWTFSPRARFELLDRLLEENHRRAGLL